MADTTPAQFVASSVPADITLNGTAQHLAIGPRVSLLDLPREHLGLTGTTKGCNNGECAACTVHLDERRVNACMALAASCPCSRRSSTTTPFNAAYRPA
jgi:xanthine dehydrogenase YagT iron-sulfur-binding subunit